MVLLVFVCPVALGSFFFKALFFGLWLLIVGPNGPRSY